MQGWQSKAKSASKLQSERKSGPSVGEGVSGTIPFCLPPHMAWAVRGSFSRLPTQAGGGAVSLGGSVFQETFPKGADKLPQASELGPCLS